MVKRISCDVYEIQELNEDVKKNVYQKLLKENYYDMIFKEVMTPWKNVLYDFLYYMPNVNNIKINVNELDDKSIVFYIDNKDSSNGEGSINIKKWNDIKKIFKEKIETDIKYRYFNKKQHSDMISEYIIDSVNECFRIKKLQEQDAQKVVKTKVEVKYSELCEYVLNDFNERLNYYVNNAKEKLIISYIIRNKFLFSENGDFINLEKYFTIEELNDNNYKP